MMESELRSYIIAATGVANTQWEMAVDSEDDHHPLITIALVSETPGYQLDGMDKLREALIQIDIWTDDFLQGITLREAIVAASDAFKSAHIKAISINQIRSGKDVQEVTYFRQSIDIRVFFTR